MDTGNKEKKISAANCQVNHSSLYSEESKDIRKLADQLQTLFLCTLNNLETTNAVIQNSNNNSISTKNYELGKDNAFKKWEGIKWERDEGIHGGGIRYQQIDSSIFHRATINVSGVHYEDKEKYPIDSATALSVILHPKNPYAPSICLRHDHSRLE